MPQLLKCPSCGASLEHADLTKPTVKCTYCGAVIAIPPEIRARQAQDPSSEVYINLEAYLPTAEQQRRMSLWGCLLAVLLFLIPTAIILFSGGVFSGLFDQIRGVVSVPTRGQPTPGFAQVSTRAAAPPTFTPLPTATPTPAAGAVVLSFGGEGTGVGKFQDGRALALDRRGSVYVADYTTGRFQRFDEDGKFEETYTVESRIRNAPFRCLSADRRGAIYACRGGEIQKIDSQSGARLLTITDPEGAFLDAMTLLPNGNLAVLTASAARDDLILFTPEGRVISRVSKLVSSLTENAQTGLDIAVDGLGNIFVLSSREDAVFRFTPEGRYVDRFGQEGREVGDFPPGARAVAVDSKGLVYVGSCRAIQIFSAEGRYIDAIPFSDGCVFEMEFNDADELFVTANNTVHRIRLAAAPR